ncbi:ABC transporter permease [Flammeovirgaceae bacterium SG7u.111]|nr:ABC transporter permease [Flammeovirgaceae bacterium SG7u.132]WPO34161.1 ABC transporter permease [Flammeovirgaceae bacterium SG7u.111]
MPENTTSHKPSYYVKKRLFGNKPAMLGLIVIILAHLVAGLGYLIMPDQTPNANDGAVQVQKKPPVFRVKVLKIRKNLETEHTSFFKKIYNGEESAYTIVPVNEMPDVVGDSVFFSPYGREKKRVGFALINCVKPLYVGQSDKMVNSYEIDGENIIYLDLNNERQTISKRKLEREFWDKNIEDRVFLLGTDKAGRDILSRLLFGTRISLSIGFVAVLISLLIGVTFGAVAGYFGGKVDAFVMWIMTVIWSIPTIMLVIAISLALQNKGIWVAFVAVGLTMWVEIARVVRGQIMGIKQKLYIEAASAFGYSNKRIIFKHIMPNILGALIVISTSNFASAILIEAGLSFLGLGVQPPMPSWGMMINEGFRAIGTRGSWHLVLLPSLCICFMVLAFNLLGNGLRDAYDPKELK